MAKNIRNKIVTDSTKTFKMIHVKKTKKRKRNFADVIKGSDPEIPEVILDYLGES